MEIDEYQAVRMQCLAWLTRLTGEQGEGLRRLFEGCASLADCLAIIEARGARLRRCPHCDGDKLYRHGILRGLQRYRCRQCRRSFNALTDTPLAFIRLREKWLPFLQCMLGSMTVRAAAETTGIHRNTSFRWRHRFLAMAKDDRPKPLSGIVEADETYLPESQKGSRHMTRPARRRGGHAEKRGIGGELDCILVARDRQGRVCDFVPGRGPVTAAQLQQHLLPVLDKAVLLATDAATAYRDFAKDHGIAHRAVNLRQGERVLGEIHVQNVNHYHAVFKTWLIRFHGVASRYLPHYLGWIHGLDCRHLSTPQQFLRAALFPASS
ncbi:IS1595 family transposase [Pseudoduganella buxea]|uniref:Transposase n=1 Tax=Pseudoduganella buxea TaxID=1949069 RepID=A0ABQ1K4M9_9BURK|nr:IS1595 family transposase [Pseudoduganella buxea]GGB87899.1 transposase [Pseudoduganella buxea]